MNRRAFTQKSSSLGLAMLLAPLATPLHAQRSAIPRDPNLPAPVNAHLEQLFLQMKSGSPGKLSSSQLRQLLRPVRIQTLQSKKDEYRLEYLNELRQKIVLSCKDGRQKSIFTN